MKRIQQGLEKFLMGLMRAVAIHRVPLISFIYLCIPNEKNSYSLTLFYTSHNNDIVFHWSLCEGEENIVL